jgi:hypothetical protein
MAFEANQRRRIGLREMESGMSLRNYSHRSVTLYCLIVVLFGHGARAVENLDSGRQLIRLTSLDNILRTDAEQASLITAQLPEEFPPELRSDLRHAIDTNLDYNKMEDALLKATLTTLDSSILARNSTWWSSSPGREIAKAESSIYASLFGGSTFEAYNPTARSQDPANARLVDDILATGGYEQFVAGLLLTTVGPRLCFPVSWDAVALPPSDCAQRRSPSGGIAVQLTSSVSQAAAARYLKVSRDDLNAYLVYLRSRDALAILTALRSAESEVEKRSWRNALQQANTVLDAYAKSHSGDLNDVRLAGIARDIDNGQNLSRARMTAPISTKYRIIGKSEGDRRHKSVATCQFGRCALGGGHAISEY